MKLFTLITALLVSIGICEAQPSYLEQGLAFGNVAKGMQATKIGNKTFLSKKFNNSAKRADTQTNYNLEISSTHEGWQLYCIYIYNNSETGLSLPYMTTENLKDTVAITGGTYDVLAVYTNQDRYAYVIKENVNIAADTSIQFSVDEANRTLKVRNYSPDGTIWDLPVYKAEDYSLVKNGNAKNVDYFIVLYKEGLGNITGIMGNELFHLTGIDNYEENLDVKINEVSDKYSYITTRVTTSTDNKIYFDNFKFNKSDTSDSLTNDYKSYYQYDEQFALPVIYSDEYVSGFNNDYLWNGSSWNGWNGQLGSVNAASPSMTSLYINIPQTKENQSDNRMMLIAPALSNLRIETDEYGREIRHSNPMVGANAKVTREDVEYIYGYKDVGLRYNNMSKWNVDESMKLMRDYPGHELLKYNKEQKQGVYGNSSPVLFMSVLAYKFNGFLCPQWALNFVGRLGETRDCDLPNLNISLKNNGELIECADYDYFKNNLPYDFINKKITGDFDINVADSTIKVDDINGYNHATIHMNLAKDDWIAPTVRMLQFRNNENAVTDRFNESADGKFYLTAGDINYNTDDLTYTVARPTEIKVEYAPLNSESWTPIEVTELSEYAYYNYGLTYEGSLANVTNLSASGWYKMRIKLTDASGNYQEQVIYPAFQIEAQTGINDNVIEKKAVGYYTIDGILRAEPQKGINIVKYDNGEVDKVVIR